ncbi:MAG: Putative oxidoreductase [Anaerolinea thermophila]|jgi:carbon-monoxide dehydrogenase medium subunit|uniref:Putative oxidoreductase n=1 Tax=Anaerolinea thermophila TaxID=167964 RepID=A0A117LGF7_9CHLR|nr:MAG: Putative oxidoreductase [Anaerolinea thermophila]
MHLWQEFRQPNSISEAIEDLLNAPAPVVPIAGGTDLLLEMRQGRHEPANTLIDLTSVPEMNLIEKRGDSLYIGACVPISQILTSTLVRNNAEALIEACDLIAGPQVRNTATLGGNVAHALPAADGTIALAALGASAEIANHNGLRMLPILELFLGPGKSAIDKTSELIAGFYIPLSTQGQASAFKRIMRPQGVALPILNCAVWLEREERTVKEVRIAIGPGGPTPFRPTAAEALMQNQILDDELIKEAVKVVLEQGSFRTSPRRATSEYRKHIVAGLFRDTFNQAWERSKN